MGRKARLKRERKQHADGEQVATSKRRQLTDMSNIHYSVDTAKAEAKATRASKVAALRQEGNYDEDGEKMTSSFDFSLTRRLLAYLSPYLKQTFGAIALLLLYSAIVPAFPFLLNLAIDRYINPVREPFASLSQDARINGLSWLVLGYMSLRLVNFGLRYAYTYLVSWMGQHVIYDIRRQIFGKIQRLHLGFFDRTPVGRLITRITSDIDAIEMMIKDGVVGLVADAGLIVGLLIYMFSINWQLALITLAIMPVLFWSLNVLRSRMRDAYRAVSLRRSKSNTYLSENLSGMKTVQLFNREVRNQRGYDSLNLDLLDAQVEQVRWFSLFFPTVQFTGAISIALILVYGTRQILDISNTVITVGVLTAFIQYSFMFFRPLQDLSDKFNIIQSAMASSERIFGLLDTAEAINNADDALLFDSFKGKISFEDVWFAYQNDEWVLRELNFDIDPGQSVAFVGHTGAGKTTIISLVSRFYDVQRGAVKIDDKDVRDYDQNDLRQHIGIVLQDPFLFSGTIASNITLGNDTIPREHVVEAAKFVNADEFIRELPQGYDTPVRERGAGFSTGQKQLIAFARALVQNPDILLVLDEATANIDTETEALIQDALAKLMQGRTSIIIAHRLSTIQNVDRIMVMRKGKLVESGSHFELLEQDGYYRKLYELQYQERSAA
ncbi:MAG: ABC transporter ATP-binding protein [Deinococcota bacterium]